MLVKLATGLGQRGVHREGRILAALEVAAIMFLVKPATGKPALER